MDNTTNNIYEVAAKYWTEQLRYVDLIRYTDGTTNADRFQEALANFIQEEVVRLGSKNISVDYHPDEHLERLLKKFGFSEDALGIKKFMTVSQDKVCLNGKTIWEC